MHRFTVPCINKLLLQIIHFLNFLPNFSITTIFRNNVLIERQGKMQGSAGGKAGENGRRACEKIGEMDWEKAIEK
jgi:hypothetical protein